MDSIPNEDTETAVWACRGAIDVTAVIMARDEFVRGKVHCVDMAVVGGEDGLRQAGLTGEVGVNVVRAGEVCRGDHPGCEWAGGIRGERFVCVLTARTAGDQHIVLSR